MKIRNQLVVLVMLLLTGTSTYTHATENKPSFEKELPDKAIYFFDTYFNNIEFQAVTSEKRSKHYNIVSTNGMKFEFDKNGNWIIVDCNNEAVPFSIVPTAIHNQIAKLYGTQTKITRISRNRKGNLQVILTNNVIVKFTPEYEVEQ